MTPVRDTIRRRLDPVERYGLRLTLTAAAIVLAAAPFAYLLFEVLTNGPLTRFDESVVQDLYRRAQDHPALITTLQVISWLGKPLWLGLAVSAGAAYVFWRGRRRLAAYLIVTAVGGGIVDTLVKVAVDRPRPHVPEPLIDAAGKSFPSGHAMSSVVTYGALLLVFLPALNRRGKTVAYLSVVALVVAIGATRLMLGVHYVSDVLGGYVLGLAWLFGSTAAFSIWRTDEGKAAVDVGQGIEPEARDDLRGDGDERHPSAATNGKR